ncbi:Phage P2 GpU [Cohnella sp. OV330]|uniref:phage tail protein n=1 Tax=Cohnella sp. OV330 TaxID=1855288 RepID=UPI0008E49FDC|nr:phage tail protein [Cohnella sp. OV330]SFA91456.1 Phage P2 GpU [Cohnella sp. OV330]
MSLGVLGNIVFQVSADTVRTFDGLIRSVSGRWAQHDVLQRKPLTQWSGPGLDEINFTMRFDASLGVNPRKELDNLTLMANGGKAYQFTFGGKPLGRSGMWIIVSVELGFKTVDNRGNLLVGTANVTLREYGVSKQ